MIVDTLRQFQSETPQTVVVVAPRILLAEQLSAEFLEHVVDPMVRILHVHSGETHHQSTTNPDVIYDWAVHNVQTSSYHLHHLQFSESYSRVW
jgi:hypothetical protein